MIQGIHIFSASKILQETSSGATRRSSGNPGYVVGLPLVAGWRTAEYPFPLTC